MLIPTACALVLIIATCMIVKKDPITYQDDYNHKLDIPRLCVYGVLFVITFLVVIGIIPFYIALPVIVITMAGSDWKSFLKVDYTIPLTFVCFFIFSGNMARIPLIANFMETAANSQTFLCSYLSCQLISNVPTSVLLSQFTANYPALLVSVNVASLGIIFSSLSGIIALKCFVKYRDKNDKHGAWYYIGLDLAVNLAMLVILYPVSYFSLMLW